LCEPLCCRIFVFCKFRTWARVALIRRCIDCVVIRCLTTVVSMTVASESTITYMDWDFHSSHFSLQFADGVTDQVQACFNYLQTGDSIYAALRTLVTERAQRSNTSRAASYIGARLGVLDGWTPVPIAAAALRSPHGTLPDRCHELHFKQRYITHNPNRPAATSSSTSPMPLPPHLPDHY
jgi:hypothetical protein